MRFISHVLRHVTPRSRVALQALLATSALAVTLAGGALAFSATAQAAPGLQTQSSQKVSFNTTAPNSGATLATTQSSAPTILLASTARGQATLSQSGIQNEIRAVFGPYANQALAVAQCESGFNPNARNPMAIGGAHAAGVFQILDTSTWYTTSYGRYSPYNASANIHAAYQIFHRDGNSWREWACRP